MKYIKVNPHKDETYEVASDDGAVVVKVGENKIWLSYSMIYWLCKYFLFHNRRFTFKDVKKLPK